MEVYPAMSRLVAVFLFLAFTAAQSFPQVRERFADPPPDTTTAPFLVWNDWMTEKEVTQTIGELAGQKIRQIIIHPRPGLMTSYLSKQWFDMWKVALREAERHGMFVWIYDENSYPSGFAGGFVPEAMPESRGRGLELKEHTTAPTWSDRTLAVYRLRDDGCENISDRVRNGERFADGRYMSASLLRARTSPWHGGKYYVDLLHPGVTEKFLEVTLDAYKREIGSHFGKRVPGVFTDEPELRSAGGLPWTDALPDDFQRRWGYSLMDHLPALALPVADWKKVRHHYYQVLLERFIERWGKPYYEYCERNRLEFTGHYWEHEWPNCISVPDNMAMSAWQQRPGIDILMNQYREDTHAQFGNVRAVKEATSIANQLGRKRTLVEIYGAGGWDLRFEDMKRIGDWLLVLGINTLNEHLSYTTIRGARKRDHPQSFSYHEPWWNAYHIIETYLTRIAAALTSGEQVNEILVIEPTTTAWMYNSTARDMPELIRLGDSFQKLVTDLERAQVEFDLGCEDVIARHGAAHENRLRIGGRSYRTVVLPPLTENLNSQTIRLLEQFAGAGGKILACGQPPERIDGAKSDRAGRLARAAGWKQTDADSLPGILSSAAADGFAVRRSQDDGGILYHHRRRLDEGEILFLVNTSIDSSSSGTIESPAGSVEEWIPENGKMAPYPFEREGAGIKASFELPPSGSLLLFLSRMSSRPTPPRRNEPVRIEAEALPEIRRVGLNVLTLDYVDVAAGGEKLENVYVYQANQFAFRQNGMQRNPWDSAVQFKDEIASRTFPADSGFDAAYRFIIERQVPKPLFIVVERPDLYEITCNGTKVAAGGSSWWLDHAFGKVDVTSAARVGENTVALRAAPFTVYHELEAAYLLGDFAVRPADKGFAVVPAMKLSLGPWDRQGLPFYAEGVAYAEDFFVPEVAGRYRVSLPEWYGSVASVHVNGEPAGYIAYPPWEADVTEFMRPGKNTVEVTVIGTLKNTLGPHHGNPQLGTAWPAMFQKGPSPGPPPGRDYSTVGYGLMKPFVLLRYVYNEREAGP